MDYFPIRVSTLRGDQKINFDAYLKINDKYILYLRKGDSFEGQRLDRLRGKKLKKMFIVANDEQNYRNYILKNSEMAFDKSKPIASRSEIVHGQQQANTEEVMENPENEASYNIAKSGALQFVDFLTKEDQAFANVMNIENLDPNIGHHGVTVASIAVALAKRLGINDSKQIQLLTLGSLLHDFEHFHSGLDLRRPLSAFSAEELKIYKDHPLLGGQKVQDKKHFDQTVINIIAQHEEYIDGKGFPQGLTESKMDPLSIIVATANAYDRLYTFERTPRNEVMKKLMLTSVGRYPLKHIQILGDIMNQMKV